MKDVLANISKETILGLLKTHGTATAVAKELGVHQTSISRWMLRQEALRKTKKKKTDDGPKEFFRKPVAGWIRSLKIEATISPSARSLLAQAAW